MSSLVHYPKRLIEVDLPIREISAHARREKYVGTISSLHLWWARRPLASCRAVVCGALWLDPEDSLCPKDFRTDATGILTKFADQVVSSPRLRELCSIGFHRWISYSAADSKKPASEAGQGLRADLLAFLADFSNLKAGNEEAFIETARALTMASHRAATGQTDAPFAFDPFAGGGAIPVELQRCGAATFASDLNSVAVLLNRVLLEYWPRHGDKLIASVQRWGAWVGEKARRQLWALYPTPVPGELPVAYIWGRTVTCEGPGCGLSVPLLRSFDLSRRKGKPASITLDAPDGALQVGITISQQRSRLTTRTTSGAAMTCPRCEFTTPKARIRAQLMERRGGTHDARLIAVASSSRAQSGRRYRAPVKDELDATVRAQEQLRAFERRAAESSLLPDEEIPQERVWKNNPIRVHLYGIKRWRDLFTPRQLVTLATFSKLVRDLRTEIDREEGPSLAEATQAVLALAVSRMADHLNSACTWNPTGEKIQQLFKRQAVPMVWDFAEANPFGESVGSWTSMVDNTVSGLRSAAPSTPGTASIATATNVPLPDDSADAVIMDPPYYDSVPYSDLADFFYVWLRRMLGSESDLFTSTLTNKDDELVYNEARGKDRESYEQGMCETLVSARRVVRPGGIGVVVFAHKSTSGWESILNAIVRAGWVITASWPIDTELATRVRAMHSASLASSIHLVCRPRENPDGSLRNGDIGDWRDVLTELPRRIHAWMPRLADEGIVGADAIFACLGPALEIYSQYSSVERASGEKVTLGEYLEEVWAAVSREALGMIFDDADASGFEEDARLTAMWLWTLHTGANGDNSESEEGYRSLRGYSLEYDAARKIAQGLGAHLENQGKLVEVKGDTATLLSAASRTRYLFGTDGPESPRSWKAKKPQMELEFTGEVWRPAADFGGQVDDLSGSPGSTTLDQLHQSMILFGAGQGEALRRLLVEGGVGRNPLFWRLAQALSALYPHISEEKRWLDGVLGRKKGLGL